MVVESVYYEQGSSLLTGEAATRGLQTVMSFPQSHEKIWAPLLATMRRAVNQYGDLAMPSSGGIVAFHAGTQELRARLQEFGWRTPQQLRVEGKIGAFFVEDVQTPWVEQSGLIISPDLDMGISLVSADRYTGVALSGHGPQVRSPKGFAMRRAFGQQALFGPQPVAGPIDWWFLVHDVSHEVCRAELSSATGLNGEGKVTSWGVRIALTGDEPPKPRPSGAVPAAPDLPPTRVVPRRST